MNKVIRFFSIALLFNAANQQAETPQVKLSKKETQDCMRKCFSAAVPDFYKNYNPANYDETSLNSLNECLLQCDQNSCGEEDPEERAYAEFFSDILDEVGARPDGLTPEENEVYGEIDARSKSLEQCHYFAEIISNKERPRSTCNLLYFHAFVTNNGQQYNSRNEGDDGGIFKSTPKACLKLLTKDQQERCREYENFNYWTKKTAEKTDEKVAERRKLAISQQHELNALKRTQTDEMRQGGLESGLLKAARKLVAAHVHKKSGLSTEEFIKQSDELHNKILAEQEALEQKYLQSTEELKQKHSQQMQELEQHQRGKNKYVAEKTKTNPQDIHEISSPSTEDRELPDFPFCEPDLVIDPSTTNKPWCVPAQTTNQEILPRSWVDFFELKNPSDVPKE